MKREGTLEDAIKDIEMVADDLFDMNQRSMATILRMTVPCIKDTAEWDKKLADRQMFTYLKDNETPPAYEDLLFRIQMKDSLGIQYHLIGQYESSTGTYVRAIDKEVILDKVIAWKHIF